MPINCVAISPSDNGPHPYPTCLAYYPRYAKLMPRRSPFSTIGGTAQSLCPIEEEDTNFIQGGARGPEIGLEFPLEGTGGTRGEAGIGRPSIAGPAGERPDTDPGDYDDDTSLGDTEFIIPSRPNLHCYQHLDEFNCLRFAPKCNDTHVLPACRQMCLDYHSACPWDAGKTMVECMDFPDSLDRDICVFLPVTCATLDVKNGSVTYSENVTDSPVAGVMARFHCT